jgi:hypothetical protein
LTIKTGYELWNVLDRCDVIFDLAHKLVGLNLELLVYRLFNILPIEPQGGYVQKNNVTSLLLRTVRIALLWVEY